MASNLNPFGEKPSKAALVAVQTVEQSSADEMGKARKAAEDRIAAIEAELARTLDTLRERQRTSANAIITADLERQKKGIEAYQAAIQEHREALQNQLKAISAEARQAKATRVASFIEGAPALKRYPGIFGKGGELWKSLTEAVVTYITEFRSLKLQTTTKEATVRSESEIAKQKGVQAAVEHILATPLPENALAAFALGELRGETVERITDLVERRAHKLLGKEMGDIRRDFVAAKREVTSDLRKGLGEVGVGTALALQSTGANIVDAAVVLPARYTADVAKLLLALAEISVDANDDYMAACTRARLTAPKKPGREPSLPA